MGHIANTFDLSLLGVKQIQRGLRLKRALDVALSALALILLSPVLVVIGIAVFMDSRGPIFYCGTRIGRGGRPFTCFKFRTMVLHPDSMKDDLRKNNERNGAFFKLSNDPRVTTLGRFLRRYSLDEVPQFWNVLRGEMSLVGPRPHPADDVKRYRAGDLQRLSVLPGMTGLWQVTARRDASFARSIALDVEYMRNWNVWLDLRILCRTVVVVLQGSGM